MDKDQTVLRRFEPSSRTSLTGEQPDPWDLLQPQDEMSRHRGSVRLVSLTVKHTYALTLYARLPTVLNVPSCSSVTILEETAPVKLTL